MAYTTGHAGSRLGELPSLASAITALFARCRGVFVGDFELCVIVTPDRLILLDSRIVERPQRVPTFLAAILPTVLIFIMGPCLCVSLFDPSTVMFCVST